MMAFRAYIFFSGNCAEAFEQYQKVFGGELNLLRNSSVPAEARAPGSDDDLVMHAALRVEDDLLMGSDDPSGDDGAKVGFSVSYSAPDAATAQRVYAALADGGQATMPVQETFWSKAFGMCTDRFGVPWMIDVSPEPAG